MLAVPLASCVIVWFPNRRVHLNIRQLLLITVVHSRNLYLCLVMVTGL